MTLESLKSEIEKLDPRERTALIAWLQEQEDAQWDEKIASDYEAGKLDELIGRAEKEFKDGTIREAP